MSVSFVRALWGIQLSLLIAISGPTASGKSTFSRKLCGLIEEKAPVLLSQDHYFRDFSDADEEDPDQRATSNHPRAVLWDDLVAHLELLKSGGDVLVPVEGTRARKRGSEPIPVGPSPIVIVEGHLLFTEPRLMALADLTVYIDANVHERVVRRLLRDTAGKTTLEGATTWYRRDVIPNVSVYSEPGRLCADLIVPFDQDNNVAAAAIAAWIRRRV